MHSISKTVFSTICLLCCLSSIFAQEIGNSKDSDSSNIRQPQGNSGALVSSMNDGKPVQFIESSVLINIPADNYVAVFGIAQERKSLSASNEPATAKFTEFIGLMENLGIKRSEIFIDFISQNRFFDLTEDGSVFTEKLAGFETKKTIAVRVKDRNVLEKVLAAAAQANVFSLIKINYVVRDTKNIRNRLFEEAVKIIKQKETGYINSFGIKFTPMALANEKYDFFYPSEYYRNYQAFESKKADTDANDKSVKRQRRVTTFYSEPLDENLFDDVINPSGIEPVVQFTLYLRMQYELQPAHSVFNKVKPNLSPIQSEMVKIEGGVFLMGRSQGQKESRPAHPVTVKSFLMDKTEVTNAQYADFVGETGYQAPSNWINGEPAKNELNFPVVSVSLEDARAFAAWRSKRDGVKYRLPTESEWEYSARNGADANIYPWGNNFVEKYAAIGRTWIIDVGSFPDGANKWGVVDLIGNVWEWTDSPLKLYQGNTGVLISDGAPQYIIRGGCIRSGKNVNSTFRNWVEISRRDNLLGFRLVREMQ